MHASWAAAVDRQPNCALMHVLIDALHEHPDLPSNATATIRVFAIEYLRRHPDDTITIATSQAGARLFEESVIAGAKVAVAGASNEIRWRRIVSQQRILPLVAERMHADVIYCLGNVIPLSTSVPTVLQICTMHHVHLFRSIGMARSMYRHVMIGLSGVRATAVVANSVSNRSDILRWMPYTRHKIRLIYEALNPLFSEPYDLEASRLALARKYALPNRYILFASSLWDYKNLGVLLSAWREINLHDQHLALVVAGAGSDSYMAAIHKKCASLGIRGLVHFIGHVPQVELRTLYRAAIGFAYPSLHETFGHPPLQAMAQGCPVVAANVSSIPEIVGEGALLLDPRDPHAWAAAILAISRDTELAQRLQRRGFNRVQHFGWDRHVDQFHSLFREVAGFRAAAAQVKQLRRDRS